MLICELHILIPNVPLHVVSTLLSGKIRVEEIPGEFTQSDLGLDDVMMLDAWDQVFIWIGDGVNAEEKKEAPK